MKRLEQRVKKLEEAAPQRPCDHGSPVLFEPTAAEVAKAQKELDDCSKCGTPKSGPGPILVIFRRLEREDKKSGFTRDH